MTIKNFKTKLLLHLAPVYHAEAPLLKIKFSNNYTITEELREKKIYSFEDSLCAGSYLLEISLLNKKNQDTVGNKDKAIKIEKIVFNNIESDKFLYEGIYEPIYPEPWATQQKNLGKTLEKYLKFNNYLGWNGTWRLKYFVPIFTWIHMVKNHGWIYD